MPRMTDDEKRHRRHARRAAATTAKDLAEAGIFAPLVRETTPRDEFHRWRRNLARAAEDRGIGYASDALQWLTLHDWKRRALAVAGHTEAAELLAREWSLEARHAGNEYYANLWGNALRRHGIETGDWCTPTEPEAHDDGGLADRLAALFTPATEE